MNIFRILGRSLRREYGKSSRNYAGEVWDQEKVNGKPLCSVNADEAPALAWFLKYWLGETALAPGYTMGNTINAEFDP